MTVKQLIAKLQKCDQDKEVKADPTATKPSSQIVRVVEQDGTVYIVYEYIQE